MAPPPPPPPRRRSTRSTSSSSSSSSSLSSSSSSPSHYHCLQTPLHSSSPSSAIPFSWEKTPGIPKNPSNKSLNSRPVPRLPLPPPLRSESFPRKKRSDDGGGGGEFDPFAAALAECAKDPPQEMALWMNPNPNPSPTANRFAFGFGFGFGLLDLYGSCKASCSVSESTIEIPRGASHRVGSYRILNRRVG